MNEAVRMERDTFGEIAVPADRLWGAQTERVDQLGRLLLRRDPEILQRALGLRA
ncbi:class II fumarate hydratase, partial [Burkholderia cenocepacia]|nr:class II fumarate hydratase [Burkholderia cenocepacia]